MAYEPKDLSGSLFKNDRKEKDTHPDYTGSILINGVEYWQSAWIKSDRNGNKYMSQSFKVKEARNGTSQAPREPLDAGIGPQEDYPF